MAPLLIFFTENTEKVNFSSIYLVTNRKKLHLEDSHVKRSGILVGKIWINP